MIVVLKASNTDVILMDCVPSFNEAYDATVTSHPIEGGSKITDHFIVNNNKIKISGIVSDYNFINPIKAQMNKVLGYEATVNNAEKNSRVNPFGDMVVPSFNLAQSVSAEAVRKRLISIANNGEFVEIFLYSENGGMLDSFKNCLLTSLDFSKSADSGFAVYPEMQFEQVKVVRVRVTQGKASKIPKYQGQGQEGNDIGSVIQDAKNAVGSANLPKPDSAPQMLQDALLNRTDETIRKIQEQNQQNTRDLGTLNRMEKAIGVQ